MCLQPEDHELWASHFDSLQRKPPVPGPAPSPAPMQGLEQREWEPTSRLSLLSEATSTCGGESVRAAALDPTRGTSARTRCPQVVVGGGVPNPNSSFSLTFVSCCLQLPEEHDCPSGPGTVGRKRAAAPEAAGAAGERTHRNAWKLQPFPAMSSPPPFGPVPQHAIEAQVEEKRRQRQREEAMKRKEEEEEERRLSLERETLERRYELDKLKERQVSLGTHVHQNRALGACCGDAAWVLLPPPGTPQSSRRAAQPRPTPGHASEDARSRRTALLLHNIRFDSS